VQLATIQLAQRTIGEAGAADVLLWSGVLVVGVVIGTILVLAIRRRLDHDGTAVGEGFLLSDLRVMHQQGQLSDDEFEQAKAAMIGRMSNTGVTSETTASPATPPPASTDNPATDGTNAT